jgi:hypothetical protein
MVQLVVSVLMEEQGRRKRGDNAAIITSYVRGGKSEEGWAHMYGARF